MQPYDVTDSENLTNHAVLIGQVYLYYTSKNERNGWMQPYPLANKLLSSKGSVQNVTK